MKKITLVMVIALLTGLLAGCDKEPLRDVKYYDEHPDEREQKVKECVNNVGTAKYSPNCDNAKASLSRAILSSKNTGMARIK